MSPSASPLAPTSTEPGLALLARFHTVRAETLKFVEPLSPEDMMVQSLPDASPVKWHLAHTSWFFETFVLTPFCTGYKVFDEDFAWLFNSYYNALGEMPAKNLRASFSRPPISAIMAYRAHVDAASSTLLQDVPFEHEDDVLRRVLLGLQHEQQHLELIATDIKHAFFTNPLHPAYLRGSRSSDHQEQRRPASFTRFEGGLKEIGVSPSPADPLAFAFDNETPRHNVFLHPFEIADRLVTAGEYLAFLNDNGYTRPELWLSEGWATMRSAGWQAPLYWQRSSEAASAWKVFTLSGWRNLDEMLSTPVCHLSFFEADAFARWSGCRLPTEFEWEHACASLVSVADPNKPGASDGSRATATPYTISGNMLESGAFHPLRAGSDEGLQQFFGDAWEWTVSGYTGYPGYKPLPGALGEYNGKFMSSQVILRGGSCLTPADHIRDTYRNFFSPSTRWQFSGLRLARDV